MSVIKLSENEFLTSVANGKAVVDFYADWCGPCKMLSPTVDMLADAHSDVSFYKINVDEANETAIRLGIDSIPCVISFENGKEIGRSVGYVTLEKLEENLGL